MHGTSAGLILKQAEAIGIPLLQKKVGKKNYERKFLEALDELKNKGVKIWVFGDINLWEHKNWVENVCKKKKVKPIEPLWGKQEREVLEEFVKCGFKAIVTSASAKYFSKDFVGRKIDKEFIEKIALMRITKDVTFCGEQGEYHTFVYDGPIFKKPVNFRKGKKILKDNRWFIDLLSI